MGGSIFSGITGANAAGSAAAIQSQAAQQAAQQVQSTAATVNPAILESARNAGGAVTTTAGNAAAGVTSAADRANGLLDPYRMSGNNATDLLNTGIAPGGQFNANPTAADLQMDPGYAWRLQQGEQAINRSAAARGGALGGGVLKDLTNYSQGAASQEYQAAFDRFQKNRQNNFGNLLAVSDRGQGAAGTEGGNLIDAGKYGGNITTDASKYAGNLDVNANNTVAANTIHASDEAADYLTGGANARAAGVVGKANAITGAVGSGVSAVTGAASIYGALKNPASSYALPSPRRFDDPNLLNWGTLKKAA